MKMCKVETNVDIGRSIQDCFGNMDGRKIYVIAKGAFRLSMIIINHVYYVSYLAWMALLYPLKLIGFQDIFYKIEGFIQYGMLRMIAMWSQSAGYEVFEAGDDITECLNERTLVLVNHQTAGDVPLLFNAFIGNSKILPNVMWIMENYLKYSNFGVVCCIHRDFFIFQGKEMREKSLEALAKHLHSSYLPLKRKWLVLFPEGGFLHKRRENSQRYGRKNNLPHLEHVTIPRVGAFQTVMNELNPKGNSSNNNESLGESSPGHIKYILDITIGYPDAEPIGLSAIAFGTLTPRATTVFYRLYSTSKIPHDSEGLSKWLLDRWVEKEKMLSTFYRTGEFPMNSNSRRPTVVRQTMKDYLALHLAFLGSTFFQYFFFKFAFNFCYSYFIS